MATVVNNPGTTTSDSGYGTGLIVAVLLIVFALLFFVYGMPALRGGGAMSGGQTNVNVPDSKPDAQINVPDKVDVNVNGTQGQ